MGVEGRLAQVVYENIQALVEARREHEQAADVHHRIADRVTAFAGTMVSAYVHAIVFASWVVLNSGWVHGVKPWDPFPFTLLATIAAIEAIFLTTFVLVSQNRERAMAERRAELDVQINLLAEHEVTRVLAIVRAIADHLGVDPRDLPSVDELAQDVPPERILEEIARAGEEEPPSES